MLAVAFNARWFDQFGLLVAAFSVVTLAATLLAVGAGEAFREERLKDFPNLVGDPTLHDHADAGITVRLAMVILTALLVGLLFAKRAPTAARIALRVLAVLFALTAMFFVIRTGHLGAKLAWGHERQPGRPADQLVDIVNGIVDTVNDHGRPRTDRRRSGTSIGSTPAGWA